jgi:hypothetical protein
MRAGGLLGDGVSLNDQVVHFAVQTEEKFVPKPKPPEPVPQPVPERPWNGMRPLAE